MKRRKKGYSGVDGLPKAHPENFSKSLAVNVLSVLAGGAASGLAYRAYDKLVAKIPTTTGAVNTDGTPKTSVMDKVKDVLTKHGKYIKPGIGTLAGAAMVMFSEDENIQLAGAGMIGVVALKEVTNLTKGKVPNLLAGPTSNMAVEAKVDLPYRIAESKKYWEEQNVVKTNSAAVYVPRVNQNIRGIDTVNANAGGSFSRGVGSVVEANAAVVRRS